MTMNTQSKHSICCRVTGLLALVASLILASTVVRADTGSCSGPNLSLPFTDVPGTNIFFCSIAQAFFSGLTNGTTPTTYSPGANVTREQMAAFITRTQDSALKRGSRRAAVGEWYILKDAGVVNPTLVGDSPQSPCFDGEDIWVPNFNGNSVTRVHASDGAVLGTWTGANQVQSAIAAAGFIYITGGLSPGKIYRINPSFAPGTVTEVASNVGDNPQGIAFDGLNLWTANFGLAGGPGSLTRYNIVTDVETTFTNVSQATGICFDGGSLWVTSPEANGTLYRVNPANGQITETIEVAGIPPGSKPVFDGTNIWVPLIDGLAVVTTTTPARILATLVGNGLSETNRAAAFDGERVMVTNTSEDRISLWKATGLTPLGTIDLGPPSVMLKGVCSDGLHFWITADAPSGGDHILRF